ICLFRSAIEYYQTGDYRVFFYHYLGFQMGLNAIYLSNYCLACISWLAYHTFISPGDRRGRLPAAVAAVTAAFLLGMMFLLSSKMSLALAVLFILSFSIYIAVKKGVLFPVVLALLLAGSAAVMLAKNLHYLNWRISSTEFKTWSGPEDNNNGLAIRLTTWQSAVELIRDRPLLGYGLKGANESLVAKFHEKKFEVAIPEKYNSHNQFLETTLK